MNKNSIVGSALGQVGDLAKQTGQQIVQTPKDLAKAAAKQVADIEIGEDKKHEKGEAPKQQSEAALAAQKKFVEEMYAGSTGHAATPSEHAEKAQEQMAEDQKKEMEVRAQLLQQHNVTYYQPLINPPKQQEERVTEKLEREDQEKIYEQKIEESKKPPPLAVDQAEHKTERPMGSG